ncbi:structural maintenance of chromosomes protein 2-like [Ruditapes philippinarum]|uniref:structural maintenance of chromosomes protein 2-like n=1 Tax=Ruditapes philippinarum TaxID=129788 RepID=UPI00295C213D|nr:structural maintenance of chromosomes protein 2-like [Ruditapes philippinarum]
MATGGQQQTLDNRIFLFRLQILVIDGGLLVLRNILYQSLTSKSITFTACLNQEKSTITHLKSRGVITQVQYDVLFPAGGKVPASSDLDITLIICLLRNLKCFGLNKKFDWSATPAPTDVSKEADICRLKDYRNKISHISTTIAIQQNDFKAWWNEIEQILVRRSSPALNIQQTISEFKSCPLDLEEERRIQKEIKKWKDYEDDVDRLKQEMTDLKENVTDVKKNIEDVKRNVTEVNKDLGDIKENVTDVKKDLEDVKVNDTAMKRDLEDIKENVTDVKKDLEDEKVNNTAMKRDLEDIKENVTDVKQDLEDVKVNDTAVKRVIKDIKENVTNVKKDLDEIKIRQGAEKSNETDSSVQTEERKYQNRKKGVICLPKQPVKKGEKEVTGEESKLTQNTREKTSKSGYMKNGRKEGEHAIRIPSDSMSDIARHLSVYFTVTLRWL